MTSSDNFSHFTPPCYPGTVQLEQHRLEAAQMLASSDRPADAYVTALEYQFSQYTGSRFAIAFSSGAQGLRLCLQALGIQSGDLVITTAFAGPSAIQALLSQGAVPVLVDVEPHTGNIDPHLVFAATQDIMQGGKHARAWLPPTVTSNDATLKAVLPVDVSGQTADLELIMNTAWKYRIKVIEDACESLSSAYKQHKAGALADFGIYNFYCNEQTHPTTAGMLVTDEPQPAEQIIALRDHAQGINGAPTQGPRMSQSARPDPQAAALGLVYLKHMQERVARRMLVAGWYRQYLSGLSNIELPLIANYTSQMGWPVFVIHLQAGCDRSAVIQQLAAKGIPATPYHQPLHLQPSMTGRFGYRPGTFPVAEDLGTRSLALPISELMEQLHVEQVCEALRKSI